MIEIVRGRIVGGTGPAFLIGVDQTFGRVFIMHESRLTELRPLQSIVAMNPEAFNVPFDGTSDEAEAILDAAHRPETVDAQRPASYALPKVDLVDWETIAGPSS